MMKFSRIFVYAAVLTSAAVSCSMEERDFASYVDPLIGTAEHGHVFVGASVPFGAIQLGPTSVPQSWDWCSGYHESDSTVIGFSHTHLSGTGIGDLFDVTVLPVTGPWSDWSREGAADIALRSRQIVEPGYYGVPLERCGVLCEMTATERVGVHRYTFPEGAEQSLVFDLENGGCWDAVSESDLHSLDSLRIEGLRFSKGWARDQRLWFAAEFSKPVARMEQVAPHHWRFFFEGSDPLLLKVSVSPNSEEGAWANMRAEAPAWDFDALRSEARAAWNRELSKISIETSDADARTIFYTAMYHSMIMPSLFCDSSQSPRYTGLSLWDTYRAAMPLFTIIHADRENDLINGFLEIYDRQGDLPVWHLMGCETDCMIGNPGASVVADTILKGFDGFDREKAYEALRATAFTPDRGQDIRMRHGYIPYELYTQGLANDMEYAIADWSIAQAALHLGKEADYELFMERSRSYRNYFDPAVGFMRGKDAEGNFRPDFNPAYSDHEGNDYTEGNAWQYTWLVPHDLDGLIGCFGGRDAMLAKLDSLFTADSGIDGERASADITGLIGQYAHGNEPSHHVAYFYAMAGEPWKTAQLVRRICTELYTSGHDGICGNEDAGQMSAWYILSSLGLYQVEPAGGRFWFGSPLFDRAEVKVSPEKTFTVVAKNNSKENIYVQKVELNGRQYDKPYIDYSDIMAGGTLTFYMGKNFREKIW